MKGNALVCRVPLAELDFDNTKCSMAVRAQLVQDLVSTPRVRLLSLPAHCGAV